MLFIRNTERWDSGLYTINVKVGDDFVSADIDVAVIGELKPVPCCVLIFFFDRKKLLYFHGELTLTLVAVRFVSNTFVLLFVFFVCWHTL